MTDPIKYLPLKNDPTVMVGGLDSIWRLSLDARCLLKDGLQRAYGNPPDTSIDPANMSEKERESLAEELLGICIWWKNAPKHKNNSRGIIRPITAAYWDDNMFGVALEPHVSETVFHEDVYHDEAVHIPDSVIEAFIIEACGEDAVDEHKKLREIVRLWKETHREAFGEEETP